MARVGKAPLLTAAGGALLAVSLFLPWVQLLQGWTFYAPIGGSNLPDPPAGQLLNAWESFRYADILLAGAAAVALVGTALADRVPHGWGWLALAVTGCGSLAGAAFSVFRPSGAGASSVPSYGYFVALFGAALIAAGGVLGVAAAERD